MKNLREQVLKISQCEPSKQIVDELVNLALGLIRRVEELEQQVLVLQQKLSLFGDEITNLKKLSQRPKIQPSKLEKEKSDAVDFDRGRDARDTFASLYKTCKKLGISFWDYLNDRIGKKDKIPQLSRLILQKSQALAGP